ncbi:response regulator transcription factor [Oculatella sp. LEGE 06141]|uniref:response regulator n=1 Tax=Oculatella sp. LEGE 06141 TaxID=1828648 RepID=UPI00187F2192|nr:response regulator transcription factor [Oculatella sp. LEGE 06141]MBE9179642.1 response regulator transcription factor [Oculatella sp. LEGE 06141]
MSSSGRTSAEAIAPHLPPLRILVVEDDPVMQLGLEHSLGAFPQLQIVGQAADGYSGVDAALKLKPDLVIMDIGLPQLDGIAATQQIRTALPDVRILMLTSHKTEHETVAALSSGADAYCIKGSNIEKLLVAIACIQDGAAYLAPQVARRVLDHLKPRAPVKPTTNLTDREMEVLKLLVEGRTNPEIASILYLSPSTVKAHIRNIMNKLAVDDRVQAAVVALRSGLV